MSKDIVITIEGTGNTKKGYYYYLLKEHYDLINNNLPSDLDKEICYRILDLHTSVNVDSDSFININSDSLIKISNKYTDYLEFLDYFEINESDNLYIPGEKSKGYRLRCNTLSTVVRVPITHPAEIKRRTEYFRAKSQKVKNFGRTKNTFDIKQLRPYFKTFVEKLDTTSIKNDLIENHTISDENSGDIDLINKMNRKLIHQIKLVENIENKTYHFNRNKTNDRLDHNITNLKSKYKFYHNGDYTQIDITNSQPFFLLILLDSIKNKKFEHLNELFKSYNKFEKWVNDINIDEDEFNKYKTLILGGNLYEYLMGMTQINDRKDQKVELFTIFYSEPVEIYSKTNKIFRAEFKTIFNFLTKFKFEYGFNEFAILLQKMESHTVLDKIVPLLIDNNIKDFITIHDSWCVPTEFLSKSYDIISNYFVNLYGYSPNLKIENFNDMKNKEKNTKNEPKIEINNRTQRIKDLFGAEITEKVLSYEKYFDLIDDNTFQTIQKQGNVNVQLLYFTFSINQIIFNHYYNKLGNKLFKKYDKIPHNVFKLYLKYCKDNTPTIDQFLEVRNNTLHVGDYRLNKEENDTIQKIISGHTKNKKQHYFDECEIFV